MQNTKLSPRVGGRVGSFVFVLLPQVVIATLGSIIVGTVGVILLALFTAAITKNRSAGNFIDHIAEQRVLALLNEPYFIAPVIAGFLFGLLSKRFFRSRAGAWVWVFPAGILIWNLFTWKNGPGRPYWPDVWNNYFGSQCGSSECLYEWAVTAPFYTSLAYTVGWLVAKARVQPA